MMSSPLKELTNTISPDNHKKSSKDQYLSLLRAEGADIVEDIPPGKGGETSSNYRLSDKSYSDKTLDCSFTSQKTSDSSFRSAVSRLKTSDDTDTTADFESAGEEDFSGFDVTKFPDVGNSDHWFQSLEYYDGSASTPIATTRIGENYEEVLKSPEAFSRDNDLNDITLLPHSCESSPRSVINGSEKSAFINESISSSFRSSTPLKSQSTNDIDVESKISLDSNIVTRDQFLHNCDNQQPCDQVQLSNSSTCNALENVTSYNLNECKTHEDLSDFNPSVVVPENLVPFNSSSSDLTQSVLIGESIQHKVSSHSHVDSDPINIGSFKADAIEDIQNSDSNFRNSININDRFDDIINGLSGLKIKDDGLLVNDCDFVDVAAEAINYNSEHLICDNSEENNKRINTLNQNQIFSDNKLAYICQEGESYDSSILNLCSKDSVSISASENINVVGLNCDLNGTKGLNCESVNNLNLSEVENGSNLTVITCDDINKSDFITAVTPERKLNCIEFEGEQRLAHNSSNRVENEIVKINDTLSAFEIPDDKIVKSELTETFLESNLLENQSATDNSEISKDKIVVTEVSEKILESNLLESHCATENTDISKDKKVESEVTEKVLESNLLENQSTTENTDISKDKIVESEVTEKILESNLLESHSATENTDISKDYIVELEVTKKVLESNLLNNQSATENTDKIVESEVTEILLESNLLDNQSATENTDISKDNIVESEVTEKVLESNLLDNQSATENTDISKDKIVDSEVTEKILESNLLESHSATENTDISKDKIVDSEVTEKVLESNLFKSQSATGNSEISKDKIVESEVSDKIPESNLLLSQSATEIADISKDKIVDSEVTEKVLESNLFECQSATDNSEISKDKLVESEVTEKLLESNFLESEITTGNAEIFKDITVESQISGKIGESNLLDVESSENFNFSQDNINSEQSFISFIRGDNPATTGQVKLHDSTGCEGKINPESTHEFSFLAGINETSYVENIVNSNELNDFHLKNESENLLSELIAVEESFQNKQTFVPDLAVSNFTTNIYGKEKERNSITDLPINTEDSHKLNECSVNEINTKINQTFSSLDAKKPDAMNTNLSAKKNNLRKTVSLQQNITEDNINKIKMLEDNAAFDLDDTSRIGADNQICETTFDVNMDSLINHLQVLDMDECVEYPDCDDATRRVENLVHDADNLSDVSSTGSPLDHLDIMTDEEMSNLLSGSHKRNRPIMVKDLHGSSLNNSRNDLLTTSLSLDMKPDLNTTEAGPVTASDDVQAGELNQVIADPELEISALKKEAEESDQINHSLLNHFDPLTDDHTNIQHQDSIQNQHNDSIFGNIKEKEIVLDATPVKDHYAGLLIPVTPLPEPSSTSQPTESPNNSSPSMSHKLASESKLPDIVRSPMQEAVVKQLTKLQDSMMARQLDHEKKMTELKHKIQEQERLKKIKSKKIAALEVRHPQHIQEKLNKLKREKVSFNEDISSLEKKSTELVCVVEGYEKALPTLLNQRESVKNKMAEEVRSLLAERNTAMQHVSNMETALNDIHQKLDRCLKTIEDYKLSQEVKIESMRNSYSELEGAKDRFFKLLSHASLKLEESNTERTSMMRNHEAEVAKIKVILQQKELKIKSNNNSIEQKKKEIQKMSKIYEDLLKRIN